MKQTDNCSEEEEGKEEEEESIEEGEKCRNTAPPVWQGAGGCSSAAPHP